MEPRLDIRDAFAVLRDHVDSIWPGNFGITILVDMGRGEPARLPVPGGRVTVIQAASSNPLESTILEVIGELSADEKLTGEEVAERAGYPFSSRFREALARLVREQKIANRRPGYGRTPD